MVNLARRLSYIRKDQDVNAIKKFHDDKDIIVEKSDCDPIIIEPRSTSYYLKDKQILINLIIMTLTWVVVENNQWIIWLQVKYLPGDTFSNGMFTAMGDIMSTFFCGLIYKCSGTKVTFVIGFGL